MAQGNATTVPAKAILEAQEGNKQKLTVMFNPKELTIAKSVQWQPKQQGGQNTTGLEFSSGQPASLKMELLFDTLEKHSDSESPSDVRELTKKVHDLMLVAVAKTKSEKARPSKVLFIWGKFNFLGYVQSVNEKVTLFSSGGAALRATLDVTLIQAQDQTKQPSQNPTSGGDGGERMHTVEQGENLALIAYRTMGDTQMWRRIAEINNLDSTRRLMPGTVLVIPNA
jgi:Contractile injection system tube protein/LysM domain